MAVDEMFLDNLDEYVNDENKVVTFKWLSSNLKVHVNQAKQMLYAFIQQERNKKKNDKLSVTYFVAGTQKKKGHSSGHTCCVVPEEELDAFKSTLSAVTSCHIYSVQRVKLKDSNALYIADYDNTKEKIHSCSSYSAINYPKAKARSKEELAKLGMHQLSTEAPKADANISASVKMTNGSTGSSKVKSEPKGSIASMFAAGGKKKEDKKTTETTKAEAKEQPKAKAGKAGGVMSFFSKQTDKPSKPAESKPEMKEEKGEEKPSEKVTEKVAKKDNKKTAPKKGKKSTRTSDSADDDSKPDKKRRKRIRDDLFDSSSEEEMEVIDESPVPSPLREPTPEPESPVKEKERKEQSDEEVKTSSNTNGEKRRKRTRKLVPKTSMDEDGFMVTEKVWESDSTDASEREDEPKKTVPSPAKVQKPQPRKKTSPSKKSPSKGPRNQTSLTSFFKKK